MIAKQNVIFCKNRKSNEEKGTFNCSSSFFLSSSSSFFCFFDGPSTSSD